jgi:predicted alpha/beta-hydrolase family hydrolase
MPETAPTFLFDGPENAPATFLLAHGAGGAMDSPAMQALAETFATEGLQVARFEFAYMAARRQGSRKPPPRAETLIPEYVAAIAALPLTGKLVIGGKSMGGRIASMIADDVGAAGLLCLGYPFHPMGKPEQLRTAHLAKLRTPTLIAQGTRDPFGTSEEVAGYRLSDAIRILWMEDGDHDLRPRKSVSGFTMKDHLSTLGTHVKAWVQSLEPSLRA